MGVTEGNLQVQICRRDPGKLYNIIYVSKERSTPAYYSNLVHSTIQCSTIEMII